MNLRIMMILFTLIGTSSFSAFSADCRKKVEEYAIANEKKHNKEETYQAKNTTKVIDQEVAKAYEVKDNEESFVTEIFNSKGAFTPYNVVVKKKDCKKVSVQATAL